MVAVHKNILIRGKVQGVYFRASAQQQAVSLQLSGLIRNEADGSVYVEVEGVPAAVEAFVAWCERGPERAKVMETRVHDAPLKGYMDFRIER